MKYATEREMGRADDENGHKRRIQRCLASVGTTNEINVYYVVNKLLVIGSLDMNLRICGTTLLLDICKFAIKYLLNIYGFLWCLHIYGIYKKYNFAARYLQVQYKVTTKFLWYIHIYGIYNFSRRYL